MNTEAVLGCEWPYLRSFFPPLEELESSAVMFRAIIRKREVVESDCLLRMALAYGYCGLSLRQTAAWAESAGVASLSDVALLKRLRNADAWLGYLLGRKLAMVSGFSPIPAPFCLRLVDATTISRIGSSGSDWRVHLSFNLSSFSIDHVELTDSKGGESLTRFPVAPGDLLVGDRGYAHRAGFQAVRDGGADFLVRITWQNTPLLTSSGDPFDLMAHLRSLPDAIPSALTVTVAPDKKKNIPAMPARLIAIRKSEAAAEQGRRKVLAERSRKVAAIDPRSLEAAAYIIVLTSTTDAQLSAAQALELYRFRWQIELVFKRLKGLSGLGKLPAKNTGLARSTLFAKLLASLALDELTDQFLAISPWGYPLHE